MTRSIAGWVLLLQLLWVSPLAAYVRLLGSGDNPAQRRDFLDIRYSVHELTAPGMRNTQDHVIITPGSSPVAAIEAAMNSWTSIETSLIHFAPVQPTAATSYGSDGTLLISFADTAPNRSIVQGAVAVTLLFSNARGDLTDTDIVFNPALPFSTTLENNTFDIQSVATHELGHALGLDHSGIVGSTMFPVVGRQSHLLSTLSSDDIAFATDVYPNPVNSSFAVLTGTVSLTTGQGVRRAFVTAVDPATNTIVGGITDNLGNYRIGKVPSGSYFVYADPLDGPTEISNLGRAGNGANISFHTDFFGGRLSPQRITLLAGLTAQADITVANGLPVLNIEGGAAARFPEPLGSFVGGLVEPGDRYQVAIYGRGLDRPEIVESSLSFLGAKVELIAGTLRHDRTRFTDGSEFPMLTFVIDTLDTLPEGLVNVVVSTDSESVVFSGGLKVRRSAPQPSVQPNGIVSAASFLPRAVSPGEIISIFGENLGPDGAEDPGANPLTGRPTTMAADVAVTVGGIAAPLFFISSKQINAQLPFEVAGRPNAAVVVRHKQSASAPVSVAIADSNPGLFTYPTGAAIVVNQPGQTLNSPAHPAPRGTVVTLYGTGPGLVDPPLETGQLAGGAGALSGTARGVSATIGGEAAAVAFSGMAPGFTGLWQLNVWIPAQITPGPAVPIFINVAGTPTQPGVTISVQ